MSAARPDPAQAALPVDTLPIAPLSGPFALLGDVTVIDLTTSIAGPYATMLLSDFGADVIKVERPEGDDARQWGPPFLDGQTLWFAAMNRNKRSIVLDLRDDGGMAVLHDLIGRADVVVTNQPPDVQRRLGVDHDTIRKVRDDIVHVSITGFGLSGDRADMTCYDLIAEGYSGVMDLTGALGGAPQKVGAPAADMLAGQDAAMAALAALFDRQRTGRGRKIDVSLAESMTRFLSCRIATYLGSGEIPTRSGGTDSVIAIYQAFETADLPITLGLGSDAIWHRFWAALDDPAYAARAEYGSNTARRVHRERIVGDIQAILLRRTRADWLKAFAAARVPAGPINRVDEVASDPAFHARGLFYAIDTGDGGRVPQIGLGIRIDDEPCLPLRAPPRLGEHTDEILRAVPRSAATASGAMS